jgi:hypothetical protein
MKLKRLSVLLLLLGTLAAVVTGPAGKATVTVEFCDAQYDLHVLSCTNDPYPSDCRFTADMMHYSCMGSIPATPDFCSLAQQRANACGVYDPMTDFINYSDCMTKSGIQFCQ